MSGTNAQDEVGTVSGKIEDDRKWVDSSVAQRFAARETQRRQRLAQVSRKGVLGAAGVDAAVRRALQMTVTEGRVAIADPRPATRRCGGR